MDIRTKIVLTLIAVALSSIGLFAYLAYLLSAEMFLQNAGRQLSAVAASQAREAEFVLDQWQAQVDTLAGSDDLVLTSASAEILQQMLTSTPTRDLRWLSIYDASGIRRDTTRPDLAPQHLPVGPQTAGVRQLSDGVAIVLVAPLAAQPGTLQAGFSTDSIDAIAAAHAVGETGNSLLLAPSWTDSDGAERTGYVIVSPRWDTSARSGPLATAPGAVAAALAGQKTAVQAADFLGTPVMASSRALGESDWRLLVTVDRDEELAWVDQLLLQLRDLGLALGAAVIIGAVVLGLYFARRIRRLAETVDRIRQGELELRAEVDGEDEVTLLAQSFNEFMNQLHYSGDIFQLGSLRVLVADSLARNRALLLELLSNWRMQPTLAADGASALAVLDEAQAAGEPIQLLVLDQTLPDMAGTELAAQLRARKGWQRCPIIMMVSDPEALNLSEAKRLGIGHVLPKPVIASDLMEATLAEMGVSAPAMTDMPDMLLPQTQPRKILLVEDSDIIARVTSGFLERWGHQVTLVGTGRLAVDRTRQEAFDLVLMDLEMPEMSGFDATRMIREDELEHNTRTPIIALTARATKQDREACMEAGMDDYLCKPVDPKLLYGVVNARPATALAGTPAAVTTKPIRELTMTDQPAQADNGEDSPIDWGVAQSLTAGDAELLGELVELFPAESAKHLDSVRQAIEAGNAEALTRAAHTLKSSAGFFGAPKLVATALQVENLGKAADIEAARQCLAALEAETARLTAALATEHPPQGGQS